MTQDKSNGYDRLAEVFIRSRNSRIGPETVRRWSQGLPPGCDVLELGCGHGVISEVLISQGFRLYAVDASPKLLAVLGQRFPEAVVECAAAEESDFFGRTFDAVVAWGLMFLLPEEVQATVIGKVAAALNPGGQFLFTSVAQAVSWDDCMTGRPSISLGRERYLQICSSAGLILTGEAQDEGDNHYYFFSKPAA